MTMRSANHAFVVEPEPPRSTDRLVKAVKGESMLAVGLRRFRTLSGVSQKRPHSQRPPLPPPMPVGSLEKDLSSLAPVSSAEPKQELASPSIKLCDTDSSHLNDCDLDDPKPFSPYVSHLQGIHFVRDADQDPDLDADDSTMSWTQSTPSEKSSAISAPEETNKRLSLRSQPCSVTSSEQSVSPSPVSVTPSEDSSPMSDPSLISRIMEKIPPKLLSTRPHRLSPSNDCESPYAPYAPTSPLSASTTAVSPVPVHNTTAIPFNIRNALRGTLPSKTAKVTVKTAMLQQRQATQDQQITCEASGFESDPSSSSHTVCSPKVVLAAGPIALGNLTSYGNGRDPCRSPNPGSLPSPGSTSPKFVKSEGLITAKLGSSGKPDYQRRHSTSPAAPSSIPFPGSVQDEEVTARPPERSRSQSSISHFRNHLNNFWSHPISRLRTSSSINAVMRGIRPGKRRNPSDVSFEARPVSMQTESSYEILDSSAIPHV